MCSIYYKTHQCVLCITKSINVYFVSQNTSMCSMYYKTHQCVVCITKHINVYYKTHQCLLCITKHTNVYYALQPHLWCNGKHACLECCRSWVRDPVGSNQRYKIGICCFSAKHAALRSKSKDWSTRNQNNVSEWSNMSIRGLLFQ